MFIHARGILVIYYHPAAVAVGPALPPVRVLGIAPRGSLAFITGVCLRSPRVEIVMGYDVHVGYWLTQLEIAAQIDSG